MINIGRLTAANDNAPRLASDFRDLAERRAWVSSRSENAAPMLAWPTLERLARKAPDAAKALYRYTELMHPHRMQPANANDPDGPEMDAEMRHEVRPALDEVLRLAADGFRPRVRLHRVREGWKVFERHGRKVSISGSTVVLGTLVFRDGILAEYGVTTRGKPLKPIERHRSPRGSSSTPRSESSIRFLLPANDNTPIAKGAHFFGGMKGRKGNTTKPDVGDHHAAEELARNYRRQAVRVALGNKCWIMDAAASDCTARDIGEALGHRGKVAERRGMAAIDDAIAQFQKLVA